MIHIYKKDILYWVVIFALVLACGLGVAISQAAYGSSLDEAMTIDAYNTSSAAYLQEGYADKKTWQADFDSAIGAVEEDIAELDGLRDYLSQEELAKLDNYSPNNFKYIKEVDEFSAVLAEMRENAMAEKQRQIEQQRAREREQASASSNQSSSSSSGSSSSSSSFSTSGSVPNLMSAGVVNWGEYRFTWYSQRVLPGGGLNIPGRHVNGSGFVCDGDGYIVAATAFGRGTTGNSPWGAWKSYDTGVSGNTVDLYTDW